jgi:uncharacterized protein YqgC (DUF456 family)
VNPEWLYVIAGVLVLVGLAGTVLPALPGVPLVFGGMLLAAWAGDFQHIGGLTVTLLAVLTALAMGIDLLASAFGTKIAGASRWAFVGAGVGALVGLFFGLPGLLLGPFAGAVAAEAMVTNNLQQSARAGVGASLGLLFGAVAKVALAFTMLGVFALALLID